MKFIYSSWIVAKIRQVKLNNLLQLVLTKLWNIQSYKYFGGWIAANWRHGEQPKRQIDETIDRIWTKNDQPQGRVTIFCTLSHFEGNDKIKLIIVFWWFWKLVLYMLCQAVRMRK